jgi:hypothetical protein
VAGPGCVVRKAGKWLSGQLGKNSNSITIPQSRHNFIPCLTRQRGNGEVFSLDFGHLLCYTRTRCGGDFMAQQLSRGMGKLNTKAVRDTINSPKIRDKDK